MVKFDIFVIRWADVLFKIKFQATFVTLTAIIINEETLFGLNSPGKAPHYWSQNLEREMIGNTQKID